ncbi:MAG: hypothetical protein H6883_08065 [Rhodobiaceae bacterium]|nr:hypothetical protein [Rhodobiaceae bacterium]MCC0056077.1 hypothetical protein [Rhodobiaceae bacterium]
MSNVFDLNGEKVDGAADSGDAPCEDLIDTLQRLLEDARDGSLRAIAYATVRQGTLCGAGWDGAPGSKFPLGAAVSILAARYPNWMVEGE